MIDDVIKQRQVVREVSDMSLGTLRGLVNAHNSISSGGSVQSIPNAAQTPVYWKNPKTGVLEIKPTQ